ncbi:MAG: GerAB/ArcD/ProY family transporter [Peptococcaceae bacterium]|nr:GerAB/ArcD/ProY family transporter [Peptococcaceae bacterium]
MRKEVELETTTKQDGQPQISSRQLGLLAAAFLLGGQQIFLPVEQGIPHNQWFATFGAAVIGFLLLGLYLTIAKLFPGKDFSKVLTTGFGRIVGKILSFLYIIQFLFATGFSLLLMVNFWVALDMWYTPQMVIMFLVIVAAAFGAYLGLEVLARAAVVVVSLLLAVAFLDTIFVLPEMKFSYLLPFQEIDGAAWLKSMKYIVLLEYANLLMLLVPSAHTQAAEKLKKPVKVWGLWIFLYLIFLDVRNTLVLGPAAYLYDYPGTNVLKVINLTEVVPQIELMGIMTLIAGGIFRIAYMFLVSLEMMNVTFAMREKKVLILPLALLMVAVAFLFVGFAEDITQPLDFYFAWVCIPLYGIIPILLVAVGYYQRHKRRKQAAIN